MLTSGSEQAKQWKREEEERLRREMEDVKAELGDAIDVVTDWLDRI